MVRLLDINVLIALCDPAHAFHQSAWAWFKPLTRKGWATCPLTENGLLRILGHPSYPHGPGSPVLVREMLVHLRQYAGYRFWPDDVTFSDQTLFPSLQGLLHPQLTDVYLLGLAARHHGLLATFDSRIPAAAVRENPSLEFIPKSRISA